MVASIVQPAIPSSRPNQQRALPLLRLRNVVKNYTTRAGVFPALKGVDLEIARGSFVAILGKSGSGKSTLLNMITGIDHPTSGDVQVGDTIVHTLNEDALAKWRGKTIGIVFQSFELLPNLTILDNVLLPMDAIGSATGNAARHRALHLLDQVEIADHAYKLPSAISGGQQQRVAIARAMANDPDLIVADEPTGNLDSQTAEAVFCLFEQLAAAGKTIIMVTHDSDLARRADRIILLEDGHIVPAEQVEQSIAYHIDSGLLSTSLSLPLSTTSTGHTPSVSLSLPTAIPTAQPTPTATHPRKPRKPANPFALLASLTRPRWRKVLRDLWGNKLRTLLVVLSIAVGVFALGMISASSTVLSAGLQQSYLVTEPASAMLMVSDPYFGGGMTGFGDELVAVVRDMREVAEAEGRRKITVRMLVGEDDWRDLQLFAIPDYEDIRINKITPEYGEWPPDDKDLLIERAALGLAQAGVGDSVVIKTSAGKRKTMQVTGVTHDMSQLPAMMDGRIYGYVTFDTLKWLGEPSNYNELYITVATGKNDKQHIQAVADLVKDKVERSGRPVYYVSIPEPNVHVLDYMIQAIVILLGVLGGLSLVLSAFLVVTTISAILAQHVRQIGILKALGMRRRHIVLMYVVLVTSFGVLALLVALPLSALGAGVFTTFIASTFNFDVTSGFILPPHVILQQCVISLLVPSLAAFFPIVHGTRVSVREALASEPAGGGYGTGVIDRLMQSLRGVSRPLLLSLRNTVRRKGRLMLTLTTLTLSGTMFVSVFSIRDSMFATLDDLLSVWQYDLWVSFSRPYRASDLEQQSLRVPGVVEAEGVGFTTSRRIREDDSESNSLMLFALQPGSTMLKPLVSHGRWLLPEDENAVIVTTGFLKDEPDEITVGSDIVLSIKGQERVWKVVGISQMIWSGAYVNYPYFARVTREAGLASMVWIVTEHSDLSYQTAVARLLEQHYGRRGLRVSSMTKIAEERMEAEAMFNGIVSLLAVMAVLLAFVGGLGLMGTMSINVLERTREIGIMRSIGASNSAVMRLVMIEGVIIGLMSWLLSVGLAVLISKPLSSAVGVALFQFPLTYGFSFTGMLLWLVVVVILAAAASFLPAWNASRLTVRDVLAYE